MLGTRVRRACRIRPGVTLEVMGLRVCQKTTSYAFPVVSHRTHPARTYRAVAVMKQQHLRSSDEDLTSVKALYIAPFRKIEECMAYLRHQRNRRALPRIRRPAQVGERLGALPSACKPRARAQLRARSKALYIHIEGRAGRSRVRVSARAKYIFICRVLWMREPFELVGIKPFLPFRPLSCIGIPI